MKKGTVHLIHAQVLLLNFTGTLLARKLLAKCFIYKSLPMDRKNIFRGHRIQVFIVFISIGQKKGNTRGDKKVLSQEKNSLLHCKKSPKKLVPLPFSTQCNIRPLFASKGKKIDITFRM